MPRDLVQTVGHAGLVQPLVRKRRPAADRGPLPILKEQRRRIRILGQFPCAGRDDPRREPIHQQPLPRMVDRRGHKLGPRHPAITRMGLPQPVHDPRHRNGRGTLHVAVTLHMLPRKQITRRAAPALLRKH